MTYTTAATVEQYLGLTPGTDAALIARLISAVQDFIEGPAGCQRVYEVSGDTTRTFDALRDVDGPALYVTNDLISVTTLTNGDGAAITSGQYVLERLSGERGTPPYQVIRLRTSSGAQWRYTTDPEGAISVLGRWGYSITPPARITQLATELVAFWYRRRLAAGDENADRAMTTGDGGIILPGTIPSYLMQQIYRERRAV